MKVEYAVQNSLLRIALSPYGSADTSVKLEWDGDKGPRLQTIFSYKELQQLRFIIDLTLGEMEDIRADEELEEMKMEKAKIKENGS